MHGSEPGPSIFRSTTHIAPTPNDLAGIVRSTTLVREEPLNQAIGTNRETRYWRPTMEDVEIGNETTGESIREQVCVDMR